MDIAKKQARKLELEWLAGEGARWKAAHQAAAAAAQPVAVVQPVETAVQVIEPTVEPIETPAEPTPTGRTSIVGNFAELCRQDFTEYHAQLGQSSPFSHKLRRDADKLERMGFDLSEVAFQYTLHVETYERANEDAIDSAEFTLTSDFRAPSWAAIKSGGLIHYELIRENNGAGILNAWIFTDDNPVVDLLDSRAAEDSEIHAFRKPEPAPEPPPPPPLKSTYRQPSFEEILNCFRRCPVCETVILATQSKCDRCQQSPANLSNLSY